MGLGNHERQLCSKASSSIKLVATESDGQVVGKSSRAESCDGGRLQAQADEHDGHEKTDYEEQKGERKESMKMW